MVEFGKLTHQKLPLASPSVLACGRKQLVCGGATDGSEHGDDESMKPTPPERSPDNATNDTIDTAREEKSTKRSKQDEDVHSNRPEIASADEYQENQRTCVAGCEC